MDHYTPDGRRLDEPEEPLPATPTPGPWRYEFEPNDHLDARLRANFMLSSVDVDGDDQGHPQDYGGSLLEGCLTLADDAENEANARLLAAAPDLYTALARLLQAFATDGFTERQLMQALRGAREALRYAREGDSGVHELADPDDEPAL